MLINTHHLRIRGIGLTRRVWDRGYQAFTAEPSVPIDPSIRIQTWWLGGLGVLNIILSWMLLAVSTETWQFVFFAWILYMGFIAFRVQWVSDHTVPQKRIRRQPRHRNSTEDE